MNPVISVIIPVYNTQQYLEQCVESVLLQTYQSIEILLIDDGSTDHSGSLCDSLANAHSMIRVFHQSNQGLSATRNLGIYESRGQFLFFLDSDDWIKPNLLEQLIHLQNIYQAQIVATSIRKVSENGEYIYYEDNGLHKNEYIICNSFSALSELMIKRVAWEACGKLFDRELFRNHDFLENIVYEDFQLLPRLLYEAHCVVYSNCHGYFYRQRSYSIMDTQKKTVSINLLEIVKMNLHYFRNSREDVIIHGMEAFYYQYIYEILCMILYKKNRKNNMDYIKQYCQFIRSESSYIISNKQLNKKYQILFSAYAFPMFLRLKNWRDRPKRIRIKTSIYSENRIAIIQKKWRESN